MSNWWTVVICIAAALVLHFLTNLKKSSVLAWITVILHIGAVIMLLLLEATLRHVFVFTAASVAANFAVRFILQKHARKDAADAAADTDKGEDAQ